MAIVIGPCWTNFSSQKLKRRILATFIFKRTALRATQSKLHSMFCVLFLKIALSAVELMSVKDKCYVDKPETIDALKDNIRKAIAEIQLHPIDRQPFEWNYFPLLTERIVLSNKIRNLRKYSAVLFKEFSNKKLFGGPGILVSKRERDNKLRA